MVGEAAAVAALHRTVVGPVASEVSEVPEPPAGFRSRRPNCHKPRHISTMRQSSICQAPTSKLGLQGCWSRACVMGPGIATGTGTGMPGCICGPGKKGAIPCVAEVAVICLRMDHFGLPDAPLTVTVTTRPDEPWLVAPMLVGTLAQAPEIPCNSPLSLPAVRTTTITLIKGL